MKAIRTPQDFHEAWEYRHIFDSEAIMTEERDAKQAKRPILRHYVFRGYELRNTQGGEDKRYSIIDPNGSIIESNLQYGCCITKLWQIFDGK